MPNKTISIIIGIVLVLGMGLSVYFLGKPTISNQVLSENVNLAQVMVHNSSTSCWSAIDGGVYDLTSWIPNHPGGEEAILYLCGKDGSEAYQGKHGGNMKVARILGGFKIGTLIK